MTYNPDDALYCVYEHIDPETRECLYVGSGTYERAFMLRGRIPRNGLTTGAGRGSAHLAHLLALAGNGWREHEWVQIRLPSLDRATARHIERLLIEQRRPRFNIIHKRPARISSAPHKPAASEHDPRQLELDM